MFIVIVSSVSKSEGTSSIYNFAVFNFRFIELSHIYYIIKEKYIFV